MKVGDIVKNKNRRRNPVGLVTAIGYAKKWTTWLEAEGPNPDVWVLTPVGEERWNYYWLEVISESR